MANILVLDDGCYYALLYTTIKLYIYVHRCVYNGRHTMSIWLYFIISPVLLLFSHIITLLSDVATSEQNQRCGAYNNNNNKYYYCLLYTHNNIQQTMKSYFCRTEARDFRGTALNSWGTTIVVLIPIIIRIVKVEYIVKPHSTLRLLYTKEISRRLDGQQQEPLTEEY